MAEQFNDIRAESMIRPRADDDFDHLRADENIPIATFEDSGGLGEYHINNDVEEEGTRRSKMFAGVAVAALLAIGGAYGVSQYMKDQPVVADSSLPSPSAPPKTAAMTPPAPAAPAPEGEATAPTAPDVVKPAPVTRQTATANPPKVMPAPRSSSTMSTAQPSEPMITPAPVQNQAASVPEPVSPAPPVAAQAGNPALNQQSVEPPAEQPAPVAPTPEAAPAETPAQPEQAPAQ